MIFLRARAAKGFTLLEVIITVSILAALVAFALPRLNKSNTEVRSMVRKLAVISRELKSRAKLNNATYRLVIDLGDSDARTRKQMFWVERAQGQVLNNYDPKEPPKKPSADDEPPAENTPPPAFTPDTKMMKKPTELPKDLVIESVELGSLEEPVTSGLIYIHYFPTGFADESAIHLQMAEKLKWTLAVEPLTGKIDIIDKFIPLEDLRAQ